MGRISQYERKELTIVISSFCKLPLQDTNEKQGILKVLKPRVKESWELYYKVKYQLIKSMGLIPIQKGKGAVSSY